MPKHEPKSQTEAVEQILNIAHENGIHVHIWEHSDIADIAGHSEPDYDGPEWTKEDYAKCLEIIIEEIDDSTGFIITGAIDYINDRKNLQN